MADDTEDFSIHLPKREEFIGKVSEEDLESVIKNPSERRMLLALSRHEQWDDAAKSVIVGKIEDLYRDRAKYRAKTNKGKQWLERLIWLMLTAAISVMAAKWK